MTWYKKIIDYLAVLFRLPPRKVIIQNEFKFLFGFKDEILSVEEKKILGETAHIHLKIIANKYKALLVYLNDHRTAENDAEKWKVNKLIQAGGVKALQELMSYYIDMIEPPKSKEAPSVQSDKW